MLVGRQHGVFSRRQLLELGLAPKAIRHRVATGRLHPVHRGVYAVGRPRLTRHGLWMAAALSCGRHAALSHESAGALWGIRPGEGRGIEVTAPVCRRRPGVVVHRRAWLDGDVVRHQGIPVASPTLTLVDLAGRLPRNQVEAAINAADRLDLTDPEELRAALAGVLRPGAGALRRILDRRTFVMTESELERRFLRIVLQAGLPPPETQRLVNGFRVDFWWPDLGLVIETDGLRYHRTAAQQARDRLRDQAHIARGLAALRFTHAQVRYEPRYVCATLAATARAARSRLRA
jgi:very-short-patch-repair endonuclease